VLIRGLEFSSDVLLDNSYRGEVQRELRRDSDGYEDRGLISPKPPVSHVLLSACGDLQQARERLGMGVFTSALIDVLSSADAKKDTYVNILSRIGTLEGYVFQHCLFARLGLQSRVVGCRLPVL
jgi:hypothetical protein